MKLRLKKLAAYIAWPVICVVLYPVEIVFALIEGAKTFYYHYPELPAPEFRRGLRYIRNYEEES